MRDLGLGEREDIITRSQVLPAGNWATRIFPVALKGELRAMGRRGGAGGSAEGSRIQPEGSELEQRMKDAVTRSFLEKLLEKHPLGMEKASAQKCLKMRLQRFSSVGEWSPGPTGGIPVAQLGGGPLQFVLTLLEPHAAELDLSLLFWVLLFPILLSHPQTCVCPLSWGSAHPGGLLCCWGAQGLVVLSETDSEPSPS